MPLPPPGSFLEARGWSEKARLWTSPVPPRSKSSHFSDSPWETKKKKKKSIISGAKPTQVLFFSIKNPELDKYVNCLAWCLAHSKCSFNLHPLFFLSPFMPCPPHVPRPEAGSPDVSKRSKIPALTSGGSEPEEIGQQLGILLEMLTEAPLPDLLSQNLHFNKILR